jgi:putative FmdB family regulatory protein
MPIYEYKCEKCGMVSEFLVGVTQDKTDIKCKSCGNDKMQKILSRSNVSAGSRGTDECAGCDIDGACCAGNPSCCPHGSCGH